MPRKSILVNQTVFQNTPIEPETKKSHAIFLTDGVETQRLQGRRGFSRKPMLSRKGARGTVIQLPPAERIVSHERATFIHHPTLEENKSFNMVKCRQRLRELTDNRLETFRLNQEKREHRMEAHYKKLKKQQKDRLRAINERESNRQAVLSFKKQELKDLDDKSHREYHGQIKELSQKNLSGNKSFASKAHRATADKTFYTQDTRNNELNIQMSLEKITEKMLSAEKRFHESKEKITNHAREFSQKVPLIQERYFQQQKDKEEVLQVEFIKLNRKNNKSFRKKESHIRDIKNRHKVNMSQRFERSQSIKFYSDRDYDDWKSRIWVSPPQLF